MENEQKMYELGYLLSPLIPNEKLDEEISVLRKLIEDKQGLIISEGRAKSQKLAYPIKKVSNAFFGWIKFVVSTESVVEIKDSLDKEEKIIRFLITKTAKESSAKPVKKTRVRKKPASEEEKEPSTIKPEEIDKKLEELLKE